MKNYLNRKKSARKIVCAPPSRISALPCSSLLYRRYAYAYSLPPALRYAIIIIFMILWWQENTYTPFQLWMCGAYDSRQHRNLSKYPVFCRRHLFGALFLARAFLEWRWIAPDKNVHFSLQQLTNKLLINIQKINNFHSIPHFSLYSQYIHIFFFLLLLLASAIGYCAVCISHSFSQVWAA